jgi:membrane-associated phospholipid phosphatase
MLLNSSLFWKTYLRNRNSTPACRYIFFLLLFASKLTAQVGTGTEPYLKPDGHFFSSSFSRLFTTQENALYLAAGTTLTLLSREIDTAVTEKLGGNDDLHTSLGATVGGPVFLSTAAVLTWAGGRIAGVSHIANTGLYLMESLAFTYLATVACKLLIQRPRPDRSDNLSFPSGHTSGSFAFAAVLDRRYGLKAAVPSYLAAGAVGLSRIRLSKHFLSDVVAGATLGFITGRSFSVPKGQTGDFEPNVFLGRDYKGFEITLRW